MEKAEAFRVYNAGLEARQVGSSSRSCPSRVRTMPFRAVPCLDCSPQVCPCRPQVRKLSPPLTQSRSGTKRSYEGSTDKPAAKAVRTHTQLEKPGWSCLRCVPSCALIACTVLPTAADPSRFHPLPSQPLTPSPNLAFPIIIIDSRDHTPTLSNRIDQIHRVSRHGAVCEMGPSEGYGAGGAVHTHCTDNTARRQGCNTPE